VPQWLQKLVSDPGWWFTAILIAFAVNVTSHTVTQLFSAGLASVSSRYRERKKRKDAEINALAERLSKDGVLLIIEAIRATISLVLWAAAQITGLLFVAYGGIQRHLGFELAGLAFCLFATIPILNFGKRLRVVRMGARIREEMSDCG
jgi:hypothetical protein